MDGLSLYEKGQKNDTPRGRSEPDKSHKSESLSDPIRDDWVYYFATKVRRGHGLGWQNEEHLWLPITIAYWILVVWALTRTMPQELLRRVQRNQLLTTQFELLTRNWNQ
jgi:hypothetical protein